MYKRLITAAMAGLWSLQTLGQGAAGVELNDVWIRALPPTQPNTAAYLTISNSGSEPITVTGASAGIAGRVEIHTTREVDGLMRMEQLDRLEVLPGTELSLAPGGAHLMLLDLKRMPATGETVSLCLELASAGQLCADAAVRKSSASQGGHHHHYHQE